MLHPDFHNQAKATLAELKDNGFQMGLLHLCPQMLHRTVCMKQLEKQEKFAHAMIRFQFLKGELVFTPNRGLHMITQRERERERER